MLCYTPILIDFHALFGALNELVAAGLTTVPFDEYDVYFK